ncbi:MAG: hypothetical protein OXU64_02830 [Gemmatimonadota bacterium]|nr:hypothetical protein [Gemmatimonadota bacterium]
MRARRMVVLLAMVAPGGCDYFAPPELLADPDAITIAMVLVAGDSQAHMLVGHPFLQASDPPPKVTASLIGPGWRVALADRTDPVDGCGGGPTDWAIPMVCLNAVLPEPIREGVAYKLRGRAPTGSFTGQTVVPAAPRILTPGDTVLPEPAGGIRIRIRYRARPQEVGTLRPEVLGTVGDGTGTRTEWVRPFPTELDVYGWEATVAWSYPANFRRASLHLLGIGRNYTNFWRSHSRRVSRLRTGISGEGVYGYFDGSAKSRPVEIRLEDGG